MFAAFGGLHVGWDAHARVTVTVTCRELDGALASHLLPVDDLVPIRGPEEDDGDHRVLAGLRSSTSSGALVLVLGSWGNTIRGTVRNNER